MYCKDIWTKHIPQEKLDAYKQIIDEGIIMNLHVVYSRSTQTTVIEYDSEYTHEQVKNALKMRTGQLVNLKKYVDLST